MKNSNTFNSENFEKGCIHSQICSAGNDELVYRKSYKGDWGDWDETPVSSNNFFEMTESENSVVSDSIETAVTNENSYL